MNQMNQMNQMTTPQLDKTYDPKAVEARWSQV